MAAAVYYMTMDLYESEAPHVIRDTYRQIRARFMENGRPYALEECSAAMNVRRADRKIITAPCEIVNGGLICSINEEMLEVPGRADCEIVLRDNAGQKITSPRFSILAESKIGDTNE